MDEDGDLISRERQALSHEKIGDALLPACGSIISSGCMLQRETAQAGLWCVIEDAVLGPSVDGGVVPCGPVKAEVDADVVKTEDDASDLRPQEPDL